jgi:hypothetical protein
MSTFHSVVRDLPITPEVVGSANPSGAISPNRATPHGRGGMDWRLDRIQRGFLMVKKG